MPEIALVKVEKGYGGYCDYCDYQEASSKIITDWTKVTDKEYEVLKKYLQTHFNVMMITKFDKKEIQYTVEQALEEQKKLEERQLQNKLNEEKRKKTLEEKKKLKELKKLEELKNKYEGNAK